MAAARHTILSMMKDEGPRLLEWLAYHRLIGFDMVRVYTNDCRDGTDAMLDRLQEMGLCQHRRNIVPAGKKPQPHALTLAQKDAAFCDTAWLLVIDADEFLSVKTGAGRVDDLIAACPDDAEGIAVNWRFMGSNGIERWSPDPVLSQFTRGAEDNFRRGWGVKTLFRPFPHLKLGIHRPSVKGSGRDAERMATQTSLRWVNGSGLALPPAFKRGSWRTSAATVGYDLAEVAHFALQSHEAFLLRRDRGNVNLKPQKYDAGYFAIFDRNEVAHPRPSAWTHQVADQVADWLQDADLRALHHRAVAWHQGRLAELRSSDGWAAALEDLRAVADTPVAELSDMFFLQSLPPRGKRMIADMLARGLPEAQVARMVRDAVAKAELQLDAREAAELRAMGVVPAFERV